MWLTYLRHVGDLGVPNDMEATRKVLYWTLTHARYGVGEAAEGVGKLRDRFTPQDLSAICHKMEDILGA